jgi:hypothetical protein
MKTAKCPDCGAREVKGSLLHRKGCDRANTTDIVVGYDPNVTHVIDSYAESPTVREMGRLGGQARARNLSKERMSEIGRLAAQKRWEKKEGNG